MLDITMVIIALVVGFIFGSSACETYYQKESVSKGYAHYIMNEQTGQTRWEWR